MKTETETKTDGGEKFDSDPYKKTDLSLVPWRYLSRDFKEKDSMTHYVASKLHEFLNGVYTCDQLYDGLFLLLEENRVEPLAVALGYGCEKYERDNWRLGFGGDERRFLRAALRHLCWHLSGVEYDGEALGPYNLGNSHIGAAMFGIMVAINEMTIAARARNQEESSINT